jgi:hypothetical protein
VIGAVVFAPFALAIVVIGQPQLTWITLVFVLVAVCLRTLYAGPSPRAITAATSRSCIRSRGRADRSLRWSVLSRSSVNIRRSSRSAARSRIAAGALVLTGDPRALRAGGAGTALVYDRAVCVGQAIVLTALVVSPVSYVRRARSGYSSAPSLAHASSSRATPCVAYRRGRPWSSACWPSRWGRLRA